ncbi:hypothetical protein C8R44DRAFT_196414 [Mycena epipterygia]|nr:hypothetical protein C8R44DRAFT_196414 [Mycena epipterygia]
MPDDGGHYNDPPAAPKSPAEASVIRVFILRQVTVDIGTIVENNKRIILGEGLSASVPSAIQNSVQQSPHQSSSEILNWSGELRCQEGRVVEGFKTANISISDFIAIEVVPRNSESFRQARFEHPIKLTTYTAL